jgi:succinoglycan biosynthesis protein ExoW
LQQTFSGRCDIIIVDDGSPISGEGEIADLILPPTYAVTLIRQQNSGVSAARNRALAEVRADSDVVVFMDSDDLFATGRLEMVQAAFEKGADFFFSDTKYPDSPQSEFKRTGFFYRNRGDCTELADELYRYNRHPMDIIIPLGTFGANSLAFRWRGNEELRFPPEYSSCEDVIFAANLLRRSQHIVFSTRLNVTLGRGVNISRGGTWGSERRVKLILTLCRALSAIKQNFTVEEKHIALINQNLDQLDHEFVANYASLVWHRHKFMVANVARYFRLRPRMSLLLFKSVFTRVISRMFGSSSS